MSNPACVHGEVCREYMRQFGYVRKVFPRGGKLQACILSTTCPYGCRFYEPKEDGCKSPSRIRITVDDGGYVRIATDSA